LSYVSLQTDKQTNRHADHNTLPSYRDKVIMKANTALRYKAPR